MRHSLVIIHCFFFSRLHLGAVLPVGSHKYTVLDTLAILPFIPCAALSFFRKDEKPGSHRKSQHTFVRASRVFPFTRLPALSHFRKDEKPAPAMLASIKRLACCPLPVDIITPNTPSATHSTMSTAEIIRSLSDSSPISHSEIIQRLTDLQETVDAHPNTELDSRFQHIEHHCSALDSKIKCLDHRIDNSSYVSRSEIIERLDAIHKSLVAHLTPELDSKIKSLRELVDKNAYLVKDHDDLLDRQAALLAKWTRHATRSEIENKKLKRKIETLESRLDILENCLLLHAPGAFYEAATKKHKSESDFEAEVVAEKQMCEAKK